MSEQWVTLIIDEDETIRCSQCQGYLHNQKVHLYVEADQEIEEILCEKCWKVIK